MGGGETIALSRSERFGALHDMEPTEAEKREGRRAQLLLCALMAIMVTVPIILLILRAR